MQADRGKGKALFRIKLVSLIALVLYLQIKLIGLIPDLISPVVEWQYRRDFSEDVENSISAIAGSGDYCLIAPEFGKYSRAWRFDNRVSSLDLSEIVEQTVRYKLVIYKQQVGHGWRRRGLLGRQMHFGLLAEDGLYYWSFKRAKFLPYPFPPHFAVGRVQPRNSKAIIADHLAGRRVQRMMTDSGSGTLSQKLRRALKAECPLVKQYLDEKS